MAGSRLQFEADYELSREVVWDALVDSDLVSGWLAEADVDPRIGGRYDLHWLHLDLVERTLGEIVDLIQPELLAVQIEGFGVATLTLTSSGSRSTRLTVAIETPVDRPFTPMVAATVRISLEQLTELLRGHPVDWSRWRVERSGRYRALLEEEQRSVLR